MRKYRLVAKKGEGTFSEVLKAQNVKDGKYHAIKCMKNRFDSIDQVNNLREIQALRRLSPHEHVITLEEVLYDQPTGRLALVFELMDANLYELIKGRTRYLNPQLVKSYMWQIMKSLDHMHKKGIFHRDIKPENILIESSTEIGRGLKLADFGSCRGIYSKQPYTEYISTRWYRAPECLLTDGYYGPEMDLWGAGCVMFEITSLYPLFPGNNEVDQINRIHKILGTPPPEVLQKFMAKGSSHISFNFPPQKGAGIPGLLQHAGPETVDLIVKLLKYDASERITAREAMRHPYFKDIRESEMKKTATDVKSVAGKENGEAQKVSQSSLSASHGGVVGESAAHFGTNKTMKSSSVDIGDKSTKADTNDSNADNKMLPKIGSISSGSTTKIDYAHSGGAQHGASLKPKQIIQQATNDLQQQQYQQLLQQNQQQYQTHQKVPYQHQQPQYQQKPIASTLPSISGVSGSSALPLIGANNIVNIANSGGVPLLTKLPIGEVNSGRTSRLQLPSANAQAGAGSSVMMSSNANNATQRRRRRQQQRAAGGSNNPSGHTTQVTVRRNGQQNAEQVMKAYGVPKSLVPTVDSARDKPMASGFRR